MPQSPFPLARLLLATIAAVVANASAGLPCPAGFSECGLGNRFCCSDNGDIGGVSPAVSENCPPPQLYVEEAGSMVCDTECCESTGTCAFNGTKVALKVTGGTGTAQAGYADGTAGEDKKCWFRGSSSCVYGTSPNPSDPTSCGILTTFVVLKLNNEDQSNSVVAALNDAVSNLFTQELVTIGDYPYWKFSVNTGAAMTVVEDNADRLTVEDAAALNTGGRFTITWGVNVTAWSYVTTPAVTTPTTVTAGVGGAECYTMPDGYSARNVFSYENVPHYWTNCLSNCDCKAAPRVENCTDGGCSGGQQLRGAEHTLALLALTWVLGAAMYM